MVGVNLGVPNSWPIILTNKDNDKQSFDYRGGSKQLLECHLSFMEARVVNELCGHDYLAWLATRFCLLIRNYEFSFSIKLNQIESNRIKSTTKSTHIFHPEGGSLNSLVKNDCLLTI